MNRNLILGVLCLSAVAVQLRGAETAAASATSEDLKQLRERIAAQAEEIKRLQQSIEEQRIFLERAIQNATESSRAVQIAPTVNVAQPRWGGVAQHPETKPASPLSISIGKTAFSPLGFVDATFYGRSTNVGSGIGSNFGGIAYNNSALNHISEANFSTQNSRLGFRVDSTVLGGKVLGYFEADFLGQSGGNVFVTSNSNTFRMRNVFVDWQKEGFEILGGQDWSFATPNRKGLSPLPADIFYTQDMDTNYQVGLVWSRQSQFRFIAHPNENLAFGVSLENPQQYIGGSGGLNAAAVTLPAAPGLSALAGTQLNNGSNTYAGANLNPDIIFKAAYDGHAGKDRILHVEAVGIVRDFKTAFPVGVPTVYRTSTATAASGEVNANLEVAKGFRMIANTFFGSGNGRYIFGLAPDVIVRADGSLSPVHSYSTVDGVEFTHKNTVYSAYYGGVYIKRDIAIDTNGKFIGYGYPGSGLNANRTIQEATLGVVQTFWKNPNYGALSLITQYSYLTRNPWSTLATPTALPKNTHTNMYWVNLRYTLP
jgi:hypothetical protein